MGFLGEYEKAIAIYRHIGSYDTAEKFEHIRDFSGGNYSRFMVTRQSFFDAGKVVNHQAGLLVKMTKDKGRGLFANKAFKRGTLIAIDKAIAEGREDSKAMVCKELVDKLHVM